MPSLSRAGWQSGVIIGIITGFCFDSLIRKREMIKPKIPIHSFGGSHRSGWTSAIKIMRKELRRRAEIECSPFFKLFPGTWEIDIEGERVYVSTPALRQKPSNKIDRDCLWKLEHGFICTEEKLCPETLGNYRKITKVVNSRAEIWEQIFLR